MVHTRPSGPHRAIHRSAWSGSSPKFLRNDRISSVWGMLGPSCLATLGTAAPVGSESKEARMDHVEQSTPERIMNLGMAFWGSKTMLSAVEIGLFTDLAKGPLDFEALSERLMLHPRGARDFLDALVALGMLERDGDRYSNTPETDLFLDRAKPSYVGGILEMANARLYPFWGSLTEGLRTGQPQNEAKGGEENIFAALYTDPGRLEGFLK